MVSATEATHALVPCLRHHLTGCALCGRGEGGVVPLSPTKPPPKPVHVEDFGVARIEKLAQEQWGRPLTDAERTLYLVKVIGKRTKLPDFDVLEVSAVLQADIDDRFTRGRIYRLRYGQAHCPKCDTFVAVSDLLAVVAYDLRIPNFSGCDCRGEDGLADDTCDLCDGKGWTITSWTDATAYLACEACVARMRQPTKRGSATNFTTTSRAGEEHGRKGQRDRPMCTMCQQRYATSKGTAGRGKQTCTQCAQEEVRAKQEAVKHEIAALRAELAKLGGVK